MKTKIIEWSGDVRETLGLILIVVGLIGGVFVGIWSWYLIPETTLQLKKIIVSGLIYVCFALILVCKGFSLMFSKYDKAYYDRKMKGYN